MQKTVLEIVADRLKQLKTKIVFGLPSDDLQLMRHIQEKNIEYFVTKDQRNALFMAAGYSMASGHPGICNVGKGPAFTNSLTGILEARSLSVPLLIIAAGTSTSKFGEEKAFQEANQLNMVSPLVKWSHRLENAESIHWVIKKAIFLAINGTPGPVYVEIPEDIGTVHVEEIEEEFHSIHAGKPVPCMSSLHSASDLIRKAERPVLLIGGGCKTIGDSTLLTRLSDRIKAPVFTTASGRGSFLETHPLFCGLAGLYCPEVMKGIIAESDLVISLGSKLEETALFGWEHMMDNKKMIEININEEHFNHTFNSLRLVGDLSHSLMLLLDTLGSLEKGDNTELMRKKDRLFTESRRLVCKEDELKVVHILDKIQEGEQIPAIYVHENGLQDMWSYFYPSLSLKENQTSIVPSEQTSLGFGCAASIGAAKARQDEMVVALVGDGAFNLFSPELATVVNNRIPLIYIVLKNGGYGWLEYQNKHTAPSPFINKEIPLVNLQHPQLPVLSLTSKEELDDVWKKAQDLYSLGKTVIIEASINIKDVPGPLSEIYGDFPVKEYVQ
jgi:acetolactate synthase I/II/III large subunit